MNSEITFLAGPASTDQSCCRLFGYYCFNPFFVSFVFTSVVNPDWDSLNPDPAFQVNSDPVPVLDPVPDAQKLKKKKYSL
jgi:hypothetical protein